MIKSSNLDKDGNLIIVMSLPIKQTGTYTYDEDSKWTVDNLVVVIDSKYCDYTLNQQIYLDYKDSLQEGMPFLNFYDKEEAEEFAKKYSISIVYRHGY